MKRETYPKSKPNLGILCIALLAVTTLLSMSQFGGFTSGNFLPTEPIGYVYIRSNGNVDPSTPLLTANGGTYTLTGDFTNTTLIIERDNITLDGAGYSLTGHSMSYGQAVDITNRTNVTIKNLVLKSFGAGIGMENATNSSLFGNTMSTFSAFMMANSNDNQITNNTSTQGYGIYGYGSNNLIANNSFSGGLSEGGNGMGIYLSGSNNTISHNTVIHGVCIELYGQNSIISYNTVANGYAGILLLWAQNNLVFGNTIRNITTDSSTITAQALYISDKSTNNTVFENTFENNAVAVSLGAQVVDSVWNNVTGNYLFRNNFLNNTQNVWVAPGTPINYWDNGVYGNYWSDFQGLDLNGDGISETPYAIAGNNTDRHPLMAPIDFSDSHPTETPATTTPAASNPQSTPTPTTNKNQKTNPSPDALPEFSAWLFLPLFAAILLISLLYRRQKCR